MNYLISPEFWGGIWGALICVTIMWASIIFYAWAVSEDSRGMRLVGIILIVISTIMYGSVHWGWPERTKGYQEGIKESSGLPITSWIEGHIFTPVAFVITEHRILVYDKDEKVYALDGIKLDKDLTPETLTVGTNISYTVFTKAGQLYFGRLGS